MIPFIGDAYIVWVPGLPVHSCICLGNGALMAGMVGPRGEICVSIGSAAEAMGMAVPAGPPLPEPEAELVTSGVVISNVGNSEIHYNLNDQPFTMKPRYTQTLSANNTWTVTFDRGGLHGTASYTVSDGTYKFTPTDHGWELYKHTLKGTIDNGHNDFDFHYVVNNEHQTVAAGATRTHTSRFPLVVRFDSGNGQTKQKQFSDSIKVVAVADDGTLDLFDEKNVEPPTAPERIAVEAKRKAVAKICGGSPSHSRAPSSVSGNRASSLFSTGGQPSASPPAPVGPKA